MEQNNTYEEKAREHRELIKKNEQAMSQYHTAIKKLDDKKEKIERELNYLRTYKSTGETVKKELSNRKNPEIHMEYDYSRMRRENIERPHEVNVESFDGFLKSPVEVITLVIYILGILLHFTPWVQIIGKSFSILDFTGLSGKLYELADGFGLDSLSRELMYLRLIGTTMLLPVVGYGIGIYRMLFRKKNSRVIGAISGLLDIIFLISLAIYIWWVKEQLQGFASLVGIGLTRSAYFCGAIGVAAIILWSKYTDKAEQPSKLMAEEKWGEIGAEILVTNYNRLSRLRISNMKLEKKGSLLKISVYVTVYEKSMLEKLFADVILEDTFHKRYLLGNCVFTNFRYDALRKGVTGEIVIEEGGIPFDKIVSAQVIVQKYMINKAFVEEKPYYMQSKFSINDLRSIKTYSGKDAICLFQEREQGWDCVCGGVNVKEQTVCGICGRKFENKGEEALCRL